MSAQDLFAKAFAASSAFIVVIDAVTGRCVEANESFQRLLGYSREELVGRTPLEVGMLTDPWAMDAFQREGTELLETTLKSKSGQPRHVLVSTASFSLDGTPCFVSTGHEITIRKHLEHSLPEIADSFRAIFENASVGIAQVGPNGRIILSNTQLCRMLGYGPGELEGLNIRDLMHPDDVGRQFTAMQRLVAGKTSTIRMEQRFIAKNGRQLWVLASISMVRDASGDPVYSIGVLSDITERKKAQQKQREIEEKFSKVFRKAPIPTSLSRLDDGTLVDVNTAWTEMFGIERSKALGKTPAMLGLSASAEQRDRLFSELRGKRSIRNLEVTWYRTRSNPAPVLLANLEMMELGGQRYVFTTVQDITERKLAEETVRKSEEKFRAVFEGAIEAIYVHDFNGRFMDHNEKSTRLTGYAREELLDRTILDLDAEKEAAPGRLESLIRTGSLSFETRIVRKDGRHVPVEVNSQIIQYGRQPAVLSVVRDITERKQAEENLRKLANSLEDRVRERTLELERANRAKDEFLANMSHEIRTPVGEVIGMTDVLLQRDIPPSIRKDLQIVRRSSETILTLINDLLDLSRIEYGKLELDVRAFSLKEMLLPLVRPFEKMARDKGLHLSWNVAQNVPEVVSCDPDRLGQVLKNLLSNALKFTERGSIHLQAAMEEETRHFVRLRFSVEDTGIGISPEKRARLFLPFSQLDPSYSKKFAGAGLGLAISKRLVELMGGEISVSGGPGRGSTFLFTIVVSKQTPQVIEQPPARPHLADLSPLSILLVEDNPVNRLFIRRALTDAGHLVEEAENGLRALEVNSRMRFDIILMDIQMPEMDGIEAARLIRSGKHGRRDVPIIALTAYAMKGDRERFLSAGMDGYVAKPVDFEDLAGTMAEALERSEGHRSTVS